MNDESRKRLTSYLKECWHDPVRRIRWEDGVNYTYYECTKCDNGFSEEIETLNRPFTTWPDLGALAEKIVERGEWGEFELYTTAFYIKDFAYNGSFAQWLLNPTRFNELVDKWLEGKEKV